MTFRKCVGCNKIFERSGLIKVTRVHNSQEIIVNPDSKLFGRSVYLCYNKECLKTAMKKMRLQKNLKKEIPVFIQEQLENLVR